MKYTFAILFLILCGFSAASELTRPSQTTAGAPILVWMTDINPTRADQLAAFGKWLAKTHGPPMRVRLDETMVGQSNSNTATSNPDTKLVIQGVSGVLGDLVDVPTVDLSYLQDIGILKDLTDTARQMGFGPDQTYPAAKPQIEIDNRQYVFPENFSVNQLVINKATFRKYGLPLPPRRWSLQQFEEIGKQFVAVANRNNPAASRRIFFADRFEAEDIRRTMGLSAFNETLTASSLDDPRNIRTLQLMSHWSNDLHLMPTEADAESFASAGGYGGAAPQLLRDGRCAMILYSLNLLIPLRQFDQPIDLGAAEIPNAGFPCILLRTRGTGIYQGSPHADLAAYFVAFLASEDYNQNIIDDCDALPPNPKYLLSDRFLKPAHYPNEWDLRRAYADAATQLAIPVVVSPFVYYHNAIHIEMSWQEAFLSDICSATAAAQNAKHQIDEQIQQTLHDDPAQRSRYEQQLTLQTKIDALKQTHQKIPLSWIANPFYRHYYLATDQAIDDYSSASAQR